MNFNMNELGFDGVIATKAENVKGTLYFFLSPEAICLFLRQEFLRKQLIRRKMSTAYH